MGMGDFVKLARIGEIPPGAGKVVDAGGTPVALFNVDGKIHAIHNVCVHRQGPLGEGELTGNVVSCPWHGWEYDVTNGECTNRAGVKVVCYEVRVDGEDVLVKV
jgi:nitrite reductase/ring-hydroxylating ferredoxin subunit